MKRLKPFQLNSKFTNQRGKIKIFHCIKAGEEGKGRKEKKKGRKEGKRERGDRESRWEEGSETGKEKREENLCLAKSTIKSNNK